MAVKRVSPEGFQNALKGILEEYGEDIIETVNEQTEKVSEQGVGRLKDEAATAGFKGRKYKNSFAKKLLNSSRLGDTYVIYAKSPYYRIAHLLEFGHYVTAPNGQRTGKRTDEYHHWTTVEKELQDNLEEEIVSAIPKIS